MANDKLARWPLSDIAQATGPHTVAELVCVDVYGREGLCVKLRCIASVHLRPTETCKRARRNGNDSRVTVALAVCE